jgi:hypothetical protein
MEERGMIASTRCAVLAWLTMLAPLGVTLSHAGDKSVAVGRPVILPGQIDFRSSRVFMLVGKTGLGHEHGVEGCLKSGFLKLGAAADAGQIVFDMTTFQADTPVARRYVALAGMTDVDTQRQVNANMLGAEVLNVKRFPTATFKVNSSLPLRVQQPNAPPQYQLDGEFTLHGTTRKLSLVASATPTEGFLRIRGNFSILQSDYGIIPYSKVFGAVGVADRITIWGDLWVAASTEASP